VGGGWLRNNAPCIIGVTQLSWDRQGSVAERCGGSSSAEVFVGVKLRGGDRGCSATSAWHGLWNMSGYGGGPECSIQLRPVGLVHPSNVSVVGHL